VDRFVGLVGNALEACLKLGLRHQSDHTVSLWNVLYTSSLVLDEPSLVNAIQQAATLSQVGTLVAVEMDTKNKRD
jgi:hypothetical protein